MYSEDTNQNLKILEVEKMITVKGNTARGRELVSRAIRYEGYDLYDVYGRVSQAKASAYRDCLERCAEEGGINFRICGHCTTNFTVAWRVADGWRLETYMNSYKVLDEE